MRNTTYCVLTKKLTIMKQIILIFLTIMSVNVYAQKDSRDWLNLKGAVKSLHQIKYTVTNGNWVQASSDINRFGNIFFMSIAQQLLIDNSLIRFSESGTIEYWAELNEKNDTLVNLNFYYNKKLLPSKIGFDQGGIETKAVYYEIDSSGNFIGVNMDNMSSSIQRNYTMKVLSDALTRNNVTTKLVYTYHDDGTVDIELFDGENLLNSKSNKISPNGDIEFDGRYTYQYTYDAVGNWITKTGFKNETPIITYRREIEYY